MTRSARLDHAALVATLTKQRNLITRQQALVCGMTNDALLHRLRASGCWQKVLPGVYAAFTGALTVEHREIAALLYAGPRAVLTGPAALRRHGLRAAETGVVDVLVPMRCRRKGASFARLHRTATLPESVCLNGEFLFAPAARAVADTARELTSVREVRAIVAEAVQNHFCDTEELADELRCGPRRGSALLRQALAEVADGVRSAAEADLHVLLKRSRLPMPMFNPRLFHGRLFIAKPDAWWPSAGVAVEVESREWHLSPADWERTLTRDAKMSKYGIIVLHFTPRQLRTRPRDVIATIRQALAAAIGRPRLPLRAVPAA